MKIYVKYIDADSGRELPNMNKTRLKYENLIILKTKKNVKFDEIYWTLTVGKNPQGNLFEREWTYQTSGSRTNRPSETNTGDTLGSSNTSNGGSYNPWEKRGNFEEV